MLTGPHRGGNSRAGPTVTRARTRLGQAPATRQFPAAGPRAHTPVGQQAGCVPVCRDCILPCNCQQHKLSLSKAAWFVGKTSGWSTLGRLHPIPPHPSLKSFLHSSYPEPRSLVLCPKSWKLYSVFGSVCVRVCTYVFLGGGRPRSGTLI